MLKKLITTTLLALFALFGILMSLTAQAMNYTWPSVTWTRLSVGLFWVGEKGGQQYYCPANKVDIKAYPSCEKLPYNPKAPTLIFVHGWEPFSTADLSRPMFYLNTKAEEGYPAEHIDLIKFWIKQGWNVGIFYWNQLADEVDVDTAQAKIWTTKGPGKMRYQYYSRYITSHVTGKTTYSGLKYSYNCQFEGKTCPDVTQMLFRAYTQALKNYQGNQIRIVAHSLGAQLAINFLKALTAAVANHQVSPQLLPRRLSLMDPFFSPEGQSYFPNDGTAMSISSSYLKGLIRNYGLVVGEYLSSDLTLEDIYSPISREVAMVWYQPMFDSVIDQPGRHSASYILYLQSFGYAPPPAYFQYYNVNTGGYGYLELPKDQSAGSASASTLRIAEMMASHYYWNQFRGMYDMNPKSDAFLRQRMKGGRYVPVAGLNIDLMMQSLQGSVEPVGKSLTLYLSALKSKFIRFKATVTNAQVASNPIVLWKSSNPKVAQTFPGGYVKIIGKGTVTITAIAPNRSKKTQVTKTIKLTIL